MSVAESLRLGRSELGGQKEERHCQLDWEDQRHRGEKTDHVQGEVKWLSRLVLGHHERGLEMWLGWCRRAEDFTGG